MKSNCLASFFSLLCLISHVSISTAFVSPLKCGSVIESKKMLNFDNRANAVRSKTDSRKLTILGAEQGFLDALSSKTEAITSSPLFTYFIQSLINNGVPAFFVIVTIAFAASQFRKDRDDDDFIENDTIVGELYNDLYGSGEEKDKFSGLGFMGRNKDKRAKLRNVGVPQEQYIKIRSLNQKLDSYEYSVTAATKSKATAAAVFRGKAFDRALRLSLEGTEALPAYAKARLLDIEKTFLKIGVRLTADLNKAQSALAKEVIDQEMKAMGITNLDPEPLNVTKGEDAASNETISEDSKALNGAEMKNLKKDISTLQKQLTQLELDFVQDVVAAVGPERAVGVRTALLGDIASRGTGCLINQLRERPLSAALKGLGSGDVSSEKSLFVTQFPGDTTASQVADLREEVTAIVRNSKPGDEALIVLQTGGGTVTGYGLAAAQLLRLKEHGLKLTIAVEQVAASGGYMMCCVADRIVASPFAVLGSIGVITDIPNVYDRLKEEGIEFQTVTAGKFKRTLTPTKKVTKEDFKKTKEDVEGILVLFAGFVKENRPQLNIDEVATGETWFGTAALEKGLCDEIQTVDEVLTDYVDMGYNVYDVEYSPPPEVPKGLSSLLPVGQTEGSWVARSVRWLVRTIAAEVRNELGVGGGSQSVEKRYMARDDSSSRYLFRD